MGLQADCITTLLGGLLAFNLHVLIVILTAIPKVVEDALLGPVYVLSLQLLVAALVVQLFHRVAGPSRPFRFRCTKSLSLIIVYGVFPLPILVSGFFEKLLPIMCRSHCRSCL